MYSIAFKCLMSCISTIKVLNQFSLVTLRRFFLHWVQIYCMRCSLLLELNSRWNELSLLDYLFIYQSSFSSIANLGLYLRLAHIPSRFSFDAFLCSESRTLLKFYYFSFFSHKPCLKQIEVSSKNGNKYSWTFMVLILWRIIWICPFKYVLHPRLQRVRAQHLLRVHQG